jgi:hypothetical protein
MMVNGQLHASSCFTPKERAISIHWIKGWLDPIANLGAVKNTKMFCSYLESNCDFSVIQQHLYGLYTKHVSHDCVRLTESAQSITLHL